MKPTLRLLCASVAAVVSACADTGSAIKSDVKSGSSREQVEKVLKENGLTFSYVAKDNAILAITPKSGGPMTYRQTQFHIKFDSAMKVVSISSRVVHTGP